MKYTSLIDVLRERSRLDTIGVTFIEGSNDEQFLSYRDLYHESLKVLTFLREQNVMLKDEVVFQVEDNQSFVIIFWACILGGIIPVPLSVGQNDAHRQKVFNVWSVLNNPYLVSSQATLQRLADHAGRSGLDTVFSKIQSRVIELERIRSSSNEGNAVEARADDIAFIQFSSGSTGSPKGVVVKHGNLIANMEAIGDAAGYSQQDSMISWMPLTHDMGLIGFHMNPLFNGMQQYIMPPAVFVRRPGLWLSKTVEHKTNILCSPNFGYKYLLKHTTETERAEWDLSHVRLIYNGAEPISVQICMEFINTLAPFGLRKEAMCPVYGLAEATLAVSISGLDNEVISLAIDRDLLKVGDTVSENADANKVATFVNVGAPVKYCSLRIADDKDLTLADNIVGHVQISGINVTSGYYNNPVETNRVKCEDGWLRTGDLGFIRDGSLFITGRAKDIFFINGQNYYPHDVERVAEQVEGIELNKIAIAGLFNNESQKEESIAFVFHRGSLEEFVPIAKAVKEVINTNVGFALDRIIPVKDIPRTTSGKLQRYKLIELYKQGEFAGIESSLADIINTSPAFAPTDAAEQKLWTIWESVLKQPPLSDTEKFMEAGGNSLKAAEFAMLVWKEFGVELPVTSLLGAQTIKDLKDVLGRSALKQYAPIPRAAVTEHYPVSSAQRRLYYNWMLDKTGPGYNIPVAMEINGSVDTTKLENCIRQLIARHDSLRMIFEIVQEPVLKIRNSVRFFLECIQVNTTPVDEILRSLVEPFDLESGPLFRIKLVNDNHRRQILFLDFHHIISDGVSIHNLLEELLSLYNGETLAPLPIQYRDYAVWEQSVNTGTIASHQQYWATELAELPVLHMPLDFQRPAIFNTAGGKVQIDLSEETSNGLRKLAGINNCSLHALMFSIYSLLLSKYAGDREIVVGFPVAGRRHPDVNNLTGMFVNNVAVKIAVDDDISFGDFVIETSERLSKALDHQDYPFEALVNELSDRRDVSRNPVFDTMFIFQNMGALSQQEGSFKLLPYFFDPGFAKYDLSMEVFDHADKIRVGIEYASTLFKKETALRIINHFENLARNIIGNADSKLKDLQLVDDAEYNRDIYFFNETEKVCPRKTVVELFQLQAETSPDAVALEFGDEQITYSQLNERAELLAGTLEQRGLSPNGIVGILLPRSPELVIAIIAVMKAGGCYLPLSTGLPVERINYLIDDSKCDLVISRKDIFDNSEKLVDVDPGDPYTQRTLSASRSNYNDPAYVLYTSGTTGKPKGVMITHRSLTNYIMWAAESYVSAQKGSFPLFTSISFDLTLTSLFVPLITGNHIVIYDDSDNDILVRKIVTDNKVDVIKLTPSHLRMLTSADVEIADDCKVRAFVVGGEQLNSSVAKDIFDKFHGRVEIFNEYGPTETTVGCMIHKFDVSEQRAVVPIGVPASNTRIYILDKHLNPVPCGVEGELYVAGDGVALGYLGRPDLTNEKFVADPFHPGQRMYKTGDTARRLDSGVLEYVGRIDQQVKLNGYRIEPTEIELALAGHPSVNDSTIVVRSNNVGHSVIHAYYTSNTLIDESELKGFLAQRLPHYMIPTRFVRIEYIPLTKNGKVDVRALPEPTTAANTNVLPATVVEEICLKVWREVLGETGLTVADNFFEFGGDSIKAIQVSARLRENGVSISVKDILTYHTVQQVCANAKFDNRRPEYEQQAITREIEALPIQTWFFDWQFANPNYFNQSVLLKLDKRADTELLQKAFQMIVERHDGLRLNVREDKRTLFFNESHLKQKFAIETYAIGQNDGSNISLAEIFERTKARFDITNSLLLKAAIFEIDSHERLLLISAHHLVIDGVSWRILLTDLYNFYAMLESGSPVSVPAKTASIADVSDALNSGLVAEEFADEEEYWINAESTGFTLPVDHITQVWSSRNAKHSTASLDEETTNYLVKDAHASYHTDVQTLLLAGLAMAIRKWTSSETCVVELEGHGRSVGQLDLSRTIGWFTLMFPIQLDISNDSPGACIISIKEQVKRIPNMGIGYSAARYSGADKKRNITNRSELRFNYLGQFGQEMDNDLFTYDHRGHGSDIDPNNEMTTKMAINAMIIKGSLVVDFEYNRMAFDESSVEFFRDTFMKSLHEVLSHVKGQDKTYFTPSDFADADLNQEELDALFK